MRFFALPALCLALAACGEDAPTDTPAQEEEAAIADAEEIGSGADLTAIDAIDDDSTGLADNEPVDDESAEASED